MHGEMNDFKKEAGLTFSANTLGIVGMIIVILVVLGGGYLLATQSSSNAQKLPGQPELDYKMLGTSSQDSSTMNNSVEPYGPVAPQKKSSSAAEAKKTVISPTLTTIPTPTSTPTATESPTAAPTEAPTATVTPQPSLTPTPTSEPSPTAASP